MSERTDDTTEGAAGSRRERERAPGSYYYDDATGYEVYRPEEDEDEPAGDEGPGSSRPSAAAGGSPLVPRREAGPENGP